MESKNKRIGNKEERGSEAGIRGEKMKGTHVQLAFLGMKHKTRPMIIKTCHLDISKHYHLLRCNRYVNAGEQQTEETENQP